MVNWNGCDFFSFELYWFNLDFFVQYFKQEIKQFGNVAFRFITRCVNYW